MRTIWKYVLEVKDGPQPIVMPAHSKIVHAASQYGQPCIWVLCDSRYPDEERVFVIRGTGQETVSPERHVGTVLTTTFVWHIFEVPK